MFILLAIVGVIAVRIWYDRALAAAGMTMAPAQFEVEASRIRLRSQYLLLGIILPAILGALVTKW